MDYVVKYKKIVDNLVRKSFPELMGKKIFIFELPNFNKYSAMANYILGLKIITPYKKMRKYKKEWVVSILVHELVHIAVVVRLGFLDKIKFGFTWLFSKKKKAENERVADIETIQKGYGKGLLGIKKFSEKKYSKEIINKRYKKGYLSPKEIKGYKRRCKK